MTKPLPGAMRAAGELNKIFRWSPDDPGILVVAKIIDQETGLLEMRDALISAQAVLNPLSGFRKMRGKDQRHVEFARDKVRAALNKAEGREGT